MTSQLYKIFKVQLKHTFKYGGHVWLAIDSSNGELLGVSEWGAPGTNPGFFSQAPELPAYLSIFRSRMLDAAITDKNADKHRPLVPHWYLKAIGTTERARGRGAGSALIRHRLADADATGHPPISSPLPRPTCRTTRSSGSWSAVAFQVGAPWRRLACGGLPSAENPRHTGAQGVFIYRAVTRSR